MDFKQLRELRQLDPNHLMPIGVGNVHEMSRPYNFFAFEEEPMFSGKLISLLLSVKCGQLLL